jgi:hypothetical protein
MALSQKSLGILAGIDEFAASARINRYEKGVHQASIEVVRHLAKVLEVPVAYFYTEDDELASLVRLWPKLDSEKKKTSFSSSKQKECFAVLSLLERPSSDLEPIPCISVLL